MSAGPGGLKVIFWLIAATNRDLVKEVETGRFREDLYYRVNVLPILIPPLRERGNDAILLARYYLSRFAKQYQQTVPELAPEDMQALKSYYWPGNVRELKNTMERAIILSTGKNFEFSILKGPQRMEEAADGTASLFSDNPTMDEMQRRYIQFIHKQTKGKLSGPGSAAEIWE